MALTIWLVSSVCFTFVVEDYADEMVAEVTGTAVASGPFGANFSPKVEGTAVVITGMTVGIVGIFGSFTVSFS